MQVGHWQECREQLVESRTTKGDQNCLQTGWVSCHDHHDRHDHDNDEHDHDNDGHDHDVVDDIGEDGGAATDNDDNWYKNDNDDNEYNDDDDDNEYNDDDDNMEYNNDDDDIEKIMILIHNEYKDDDDDQGGSLRRHPCWLW